MAIVGSTLNVTGSIPGNDVSPEAPTHLVDYCAVAPGSAKPMIFSSSTSMPELAECFIGLLDAIVDSIEWPEAVASDGDDEPSVGSVTADSLR